MNKPILCLDFDGVIHSYTSDWKGPTVISDPPVPGALEFIVAASELFEIHIYSSRSYTDAGVAAMSKWLYKAFSASVGIDWVGAYAEIEWPKTKPSAFLTIDDRALTFAGVFPAMSQLLTFKPWNKK